MSFYKRTPARVYNTVHKVPGGSIVTLFIEDSSYSIVKANEHVFKRGFEEANYCTVGCFCIYEKENGERYCKQTKSWPTIGSGYNYHHLAIGEFNNYGHRLISVVPSLNNFK